MTGSAELHRGRLAKHPKVISVRSLTREDLARLREPRVGPPRVKKLRRIHHTVARLIAMGHPDAEICVITGYSQTRVTQLRVDPAMIELVAKLDADRLERIDAKLDLANEKMVAIKMRTLDLVLDELDEIEASEDRVPIRTILPIVTEMADRTGHGKHSSTTNVNVNFAQTMKELAQRRGKSNVIDAKAVPVASVSAPQGPLSPTPSAVPAAQQQPVVSFRRRA